MYVICIQLNCIGVIETDESGQKHLNCNVIDDKVVPREPYCF